MCNGEPLSNDQAASIMMDNSQDKEQEDLLQRRLQGVLPEIDIAGDRYITDLRSEELRSLDTPYVKLLFEDMNFDELPGTYDFLNTPTTKNIIVPHPEPYKKS